MTSVPFVTGKPNGQRLSRGPQGHRFQPLVGRNQRASAAARPAGRLRPAELLFKQVDGAINPAFITAEPGILAPVHWNYTPGCLPWAHSFRPARLWQDASIL
jgi:hypothetical protein